MCSTCLKSNVDICNRELQIANHCVDDCPEPSASRCWLIIIELESLLRGNDSLIFI